MSIDQFYIREEKLRLNALGVRPLQFEGLNCSLLKHFYNFERMLFASSMLPLIHVYSTVILYTLYFSYYE